jgi:cytochrome c oxidase subunit 2
MHKFPLAKLSIGAIALAAVVLALALVVSGGRGSGDDPLTVDVFSRQYAWSFGYPGKDNALSGKVMHLPLGRRVEFKMHSLDVAHAFWVPEWRINEVTAPGTTATASVTPEKAGTFQVICAEYCGIAHGVMKAKIIVEPPAEFRKWVEGLKRKVSARSLESIRVDKKLESSLSN